MFNLLVKAGAWANGRDTTLASRVFEHTEKALVDRFKPGGQLDLGSLRALPTLFVQEGREDQVARIGTITRVRITAKDVSLEYTYDLDIPALLNRSLYEFRDDLDIDEFEFIRTHWSIKDIDLYRVLLKVSQPRRQRPTVFQLSEHENIEPSLMSAMMPFDLDLMLCMRPCNAQQLRLVFDVEELTISGRIPRSFKTSRHSLIDRKLLFAIARAEIRIVL
jgi:hypothetical protein